MKGGGQWNGRPKTAARGADGSGWLRGANALAALDTALNAIDAPAIAETLGITERTVEFHVKGIFDKAGVDNRATLFAKLLEP